MKTTKIYFLFAAFASLFMMAACGESDDDGMGGNDAVPAGALPSADFTLNNLPDEPYAEDAVRIVAEDGTAPFYSLELMSDGNYLLATSRPYNSYTPYVGVAARPDGSFSISRSRKAKAVRAKRTTDANGTMILPDGSKYGKFTKIGTKRYLLDGGIEVDLQHATGSEQTVSYKNYDGTVSTVYVNVSEMFTEDETKSLCRTWNYNSFEIWAYWNGSYIAHGKQVVNNGKVSSEFTSAGGALLDMLELDRDEFLDDDDELCYKVIFTTAGTYICFYLDGDTEVARWQWVDKAQGTFHYEDMPGEDYDDDWDGYVTVRFAGKQMRIYEDYTARDGGMTMRSVVVNTLTAAN